MKRWAFCAGLGTLLGDLLALLVHGRGLAFVVGHHDQVLLVAEADTRGAFVHRLLVGLVAGRETIDQLESGGVVHGQREPAGRLRRCPLALGDGAEAHLGRSRHVFSSEPDCVGTMPTLFGSSNDKH